MKTRSNLPPVGIVTDKLIMRRGTDQMFAAVVFTPGMPSLLTMVSVGMELVTKHDGDIIAGDIRVVCALKIIKSQVLH